MLVPLFFYVAQGLTQAVVNNQEGINRLMDQGQKMRTVGATAMNETSSRSHSIFTIVVEINDVDEAGKDHIRVGKASTIFRAPKVALYSSQEFCTLSRSTKRSSTVRVTSSACGPLLEKRSRSNTTTLFYVQTKRSPRGPSAPTIFRGCAFPTEYRCLPSCLPRPPTAEPRGSRGI